MRTCLSGICWSVSWSTISGIFSRAEKDPFGGPTFELSLIWKIRRIHLTCVSKMLVQLFNSDNHGVICGNYQTLHTTFDRIKLMFQRSYRSVFGQTLLFRCIWAINCVLELLQTSLEWNNGAVLGTWKLNCHFKTHEQPLGGCYWYSFHRNSDANLVRQSVFVPCWNNEIYASKSAIFAFRYCHIWCTFLNETWWINEFVNSALCLNWSVYWENCSSAYVTEILSKELKFGELAEPR